MRWDARGPKITPNLDQLGRDGCEFVRAYSTTPTCTPARAAILTGRSPWFHGMLGYGKIATEYPQGEFVPLLNKLGYITASVGKDHFGWNFTANEGIPHGFASTQLYDGVGNGFNVTNVEYDNYDQWFQQKMPHVDPNKGFVNHNEWRARPYPFDAFYHPTAWTGRRAVKFLSEHDKAHPFFLKVSFHRPHSQYDPPPAYFERIPEALVRPPIVGGNWDTVYSVSSDCGSSKPDAWCGNMGENATMYTRRSYLANVLFVDEQIGEVINAVNENGFGNNTFILFVSDHGDGQGDHYHWRKGYPYEFSAHVPMVVWWPKNMYAFNRGQRSKHVVELRDLLPTFLDVGGGSSLIPENINGSSLLTILQGGLTTWREWIDLEHNICYNISNHWNALTDGKFKYIFRAFYGDEQLFDLEKDPGEITNLADKIAYQQTLKLWRSRLVRQFVEEGRGTAWVEDSPGVEGKRLKRRVTGLPYSPYYPHQNT